MTKTTHFFIKTLSNLHVGSGEQNFGVVDNLVQKDQITQLPVIHSSSLKGAIRDHFESKKTSKSAIDKIFGFSHSDAASAGEVKFVQAELLALPVRSNKQLFFLATTPQILQSYIESYEVFTNKKLDLQLPSIGANEIVISTKDTDCYVEDYQVSKTDDKKLQTISKKLFEDKPVALLGDDIFKNLTLPIITRNKIAKDANDDNNLFFEEVVPRHSIFYTYIITPSEQDMENSDKNELQKVFDKFLATIKSDIIQIGANASIGYGLCKFEERA